MLYSKRKKNSAVFRYMATFTQFPRSGTYYTALASLDGSQAAPATVFPPSIAKHIFWNEIGYLYRAIVFLELRCNILKNEYIAEYMKENRALQLESRSFYAVSGSIVPLFYIKRSNILIFGYISAYFLAFTPYFD